MVEVQQSNGSGAWLQAWEKADSDMEGGRARGTPVAHGFRHGGKQLLAWSGNSTAHSVLGRQNQVQGGVRLESMSREQGGWRGRWEKEKEGAVPQVF